MIIQLSHIKSSNENRALIAKPKNLLPTSLRVDVVVAAAVVVV
jgi:hypothetical protein